MDALWEIRNAGGQDAFELAFASKVGGRNGAYLLLSCNYTTRASEKKSANASCKDAYTRGYADARKAIMDTVHSQPAVKPTDDAEDEDAHNILANPTPSPLIGHAIAPAQRIIQTSIATTVNGNATSPAPPKKPRLNRPLVQQTKIVRETKMVVKM